MTEPCDAEAHSAPRIDSILCLEARSGPEQWNVQTQAGRLRGREPRHGSHSRASAGVRVAWPAVMQFQSICKSRGPLRGMELAIFIAESLELRERGCCENNEEKKRQYVSFTGLFVQIRISSRSHWAQNTFFFQRQSLYCLPSSKEMCAQRIFKR